MRINLITNIDNEAGLQRHTDILKGILEGMGHTTQPVHYKKRNTWKTADLNIFIEVIEEDAIKLSPKNWFIPMPEWFYAGHWKKSLKYMNLVLVHTKHAQVLMQKYCRSHFLGFESIDIYDPDVPRKRAFLHCAGKSLNKNTNKIISAWETHLLKHPLVIISRNHKKSSNQAIKFIYRASDEQMIRLMNECVFHICIGRYEGWGHNHHESLGCAGLVLTHNKPPSSEFHAAMRINAQQDGRQQIAPMFSPNPVTIAKAANQMMAFDDDQLISLGIKARQAFFNESDLFRSNLENFLKS